jgi:hypothetical protein
VAADTLAETTVDRLTLREDPRLGGRVIGIAALGLRAWVIRGPVAADGYQWFRLKAAPAAGRCEGRIEPDDMSCSDWIGWAAGLTPSGDVWLTAAAVDCPQELDLRAYLSLTHDERLYCAGSDNWTLRVYVPPLEGGRGCLPVWVIDPAWMDGSCTLTFPQPVKRRLDEDSRLQMFTPPRLNACDEAVQACWWQEDKGQWLTITGHLDDPVAQKCRPVLSDAFADEDVGPPPDTDLVVHACRLHFVVRSVDKAP